MSFIQVKVIATEENHLALVLFVQRKHTMLKIIFFSGLSELL